MNNQPTGASMSIPSKKLNHYKTIGKERNLNNKQNPSVSSSNMMSNEEFNNYLQREQNLYKNNHNIFINAHGLILSEEFIIVPHGINISFLAEKGEKLYEKNYSHILNSFRLTQIRGSDAHFTPQDALMNNMSLTFFVIFKKSINPNNPKYITSFDVSGIISDNHLKKFIDLDDSVFENYGISFVTHKFQEKDLNHSKKRKDVLMRIINFGENIFGAIFSTNNEIYIINNMFFNKNLRDELIEYIDGELGLMGNIKINCKLPEIVMDRIIKLSFHFHSNEIIPFETLKETNFKLNLNDVLHYIDVYNRKKKIKDQLVHILSCRNYDLEKKTLSNNILQSSVIEPGTRTVSNLIRIPSSHEYYINSFYDIHNRFISQRQLLLGYLEKNYGLRVLQKNYRNFKKKFNEQELIINLTDINFFWIIFNTICTRIYKDNFKENIFYEPEVEVINLLINFLKINNNTNNVNIFIDKIKKTRLFIVFVRAYNKIRSSKNQEEQLSHTSQQVPEVINHMAYGGKQKKIVLKGSYKGVSKISPMKTFDIIKSVSICKSKKCLQPKKEIEYFINQFHISQKENGTYFIYHMYDAFDPKTMKKTLSGRWYDQEKIEFIQKKLDSKNKTFTVTFKNYEDEDTLKTYPVDIIIYFNEKGWKKLTKFIGFEE